MKQDMLDVLDAWFDAKLDDIHTLIPAKIESYEGHSTRIATVKPLIKLRNSQKQTIAIPPIQNVPVVFPGCGIFEILLPLKKGYGCKLAFSEVGIGNFLNGNVEVDADDISRFSLTDAICIPGLWSKSNIPASRKATIEVLEDGTIKQDGKAIELNGNTKRFVTHTELNTALQSQNTQLATHTHLYSPGPLAQIVTATPLPVPSIDISAAETQTIKTGG